MNPVAMNIMQQKTPRMASFFIPNAATGPNCRLCRIKSADAIIQGSASRFTADQVNGNLDYIFNAKDRLAGKYYFQRDPNTNPFASSVAQRFPANHARRKPGSLPRQHYDCYAKFKLGAALWFHPRDSLCAARRRFLTPSRVGITIPTSAMFPQINIGNADGLSDRSVIGPSNFANAGIFQNNFGGASNLGWVHGRHSIQTGFNFDYTQLNVINKDSSVARLNFADFAGFMTGLSV